MVKVKGRKTAPKAQKGKKRMVPRPMRNTMDSMTEAVLRDPCTGPIVHIHPGESGSIGRFTQDITVNTTAGFTAGYVCYWPASNVYLSYGATTAAAAGTPGTFPGPGAGVLATVARKARANAACIQVLPSSVSMTNMTGEISTGMVTADTLTTLSSFSVDQVFQLFTRRDTLSKKQFEQIWKPNISDQTYGSANTLNDGTFVINTPDDSNMIVIAFRGFPAATGLSFRITTVLEYTPRPGLGIAATQTTTPVPYGNAISAAARLDAKNPQWVYQLGHVVGALAGVAADAAGGWAVRGVTRLVQGLAM